MKEHSLPVSGIKYLLQKQGWVDIPSSGVSMYPLIKEGDICRFIPLGSKEVKKGEVLLFVSNQGQLIGHRYYDNFVEKGVLYYVCKGDTNISVDSPIKKSQLIGKLVFIKKKKFQLNSQGFIAQLWGGIVLTFPSLPRGCKKYLDLRTRLRIWSK
ncbi:S24/S26 family peptidase [Bacillus sp. GB_SG_008]|uniref:S24/S26 family peptidase n=1 Tax=Bacillus sp. GB_SG_008 TaxID=3454627 RepID=UPI003F845AFF